jgi:NADPH:quinone reductase-like Zn-dependent oxidoreductase
VKAIVLRGHGGPETLRLAEFADPEPAADEVVVRVRACGVNNLDTQIRRGIPGVAIEMPHILGCDISGEVEALGERAAAARGAKDGPLGPLAAGDRVIAAPGIGCGACAECAAGNDSACARYAMLGYQRHGGYAEKVRVPARALLRVSDRWSFDEWASAPLVFLTAWHMLIGRARLAPGETVLVLAAGSGVGIAATQVARRVGARVIAASASDAKLEKAKALGADAGVNYAQEGWHKEVRRLTGGAGADVAVEHTGAETWLGSLASLARGGRLVTCGATTGPHVALDIRHLFVKQLSILGSYMGSLRELLAVVALLERGELSPVVDSTLPLASARAAHEKVASRDLFGKIVLVP